MPTKDETTDNEQDTSSDKAGQSSAKKGGITSKGKSYTDEQIAKIRSDAAAEAGRQRKAAEDKSKRLEGELQSVTSRLDSIERERNESLLAEARGDPDKLRNYQSEQTLSQRQREFEKRERDIIQREEQYKVDVEQLSKDRSVVSVAYVAAKHGLEPADLEDLGISDPDQLDKVAERIAARGTAAKTGGEGGEGGEDEDEFNPDSGDTLGGGGDKSLTTESAEKMNMASLEKALEEKTS